MANSLPYYKFEANAWLTGKIQLCTHEEKGIFTDLLARIWANGGSLPITKLLHRQLGMAQGTLSDVVGTFTDLEIMECNDDVLRVKFIDDQLKARGAFLKSCSEAGKKSAEKRSQSKVPQAREEKRREESIKDKKKTKSLPQAATDIAEKLGTILQTHHEKNLPRATWIKWADPIEKLERLDGISYDRQVAALDWYSQNIGDQYCPVIESGKAFREKYTKLQAACKRAKSTGKPDDFFDPATRPPQPLPRKTLDYLTNPQHHGRSAQAGGPVNAKHSQADVTEQQPQATGSTTSTEDDQ